MKKHIKIYIVTYKRCDILNDTLSKLFDSDFGAVRNTEVNIINNHSEFRLNDEFKGKVNVLHNVLRPDWSNGNLGENWNQALINGFRNLSKPDTEYLVTLQNDTSVHPKWYSNLMEMHQRYNFVVGKYGDNLVSYTPQAVKKIGIWDENFFGVQYKEGDYWIRALIFNRNQSMINDVSHGLTLNNEHALELDTCVDRNFVVNENNKIRRQADDPEHQKIWETRSGLYKDIAWKYFKHKWNGTWIEEPTKSKWVKDWPKEFVQYPPDLSKSKVTTYMKYFYFEKDIEGLKHKGYLL